MKRCSAMALIVLLTSACGLSVGIGPNDRPEGGGVFAAGTSDGTIRSTPSVSQTSTTSFEAGTPPTSTTTPDTDDGSQAGSSTTTGSAPTSTTTVVGSTTTSTAAGDGNTTTSVSESTTTTTTVPDVEDLGTVFSEDEAFVNHACDGRGVAISGSGGDYTLEGSCGTVLITGSFNTVFIDEVNVIDLTGTLNAVVYGSGDPVVNDHDGDNIVTGG